ncbi:MAG: TetR/AcrR family transcriptional regulator [Deinococcota bacterium]|nr:TetR/AcrR family transcriptional regulator [Deinococcota bacterium]
MAEAVQPVTARGEATRQKILAAAEGEFGERGFHGASVSSITRRAGVGQGTFYLYFAGKEDALRELVRGMGRELRRALSVATEGTEDRLEVEREGFRAFARFSLEHDKLYRVVMESQFVDASIYRDYYETLAGAYTAGLERAQVKGQIRAGDASVQAWALMGVAHFLGLRYAIWQGREPSEDELSAVFDFIAHGLEPEGD